MDARIPIVESIRVHIDSTLSIYYWYNYSKHKYQYTRSDEPMCIQTEPKCNTRLSYEEFMEYVRSKHQKYVDNSL